MMNYKTQQELVKIYEDRCRNVYKESPDLIRLTMTDDMDNLILNKKWTVDHGTKKHKICSITPRSVLLNVYEDEYAPNKFDDYFIDESPFTRANFLYIISDNGIQFKHAWNHEVYGRGYCRWLVFNYYLKQYPHILSDSIHTPDGERYWKGMVFEALQNHYKVAVYNIITKKETPITNSEMIDDYYYRNDRSAYIFKIYSK